MCIPAREGKDSDLIISAALHKADEALALLDAERPSECHWSGDEYTGNWYGDCGIEFCFIDGTPTENEMAYCPKCGGKLIDDGYPKQEDDEDEEK
jgi:hypothetical protein